MTVLSKSTVTAPTLIWGKNHFCGSGKSSVLRAWEKSPEEPTGGALAGHVRVAKDLRQTLVMSQSVAVDLSARSRPDPQPKTLDQLRGFIGPIRSSLE
jgi:hypothetical protein